MRLRSSVVEHQPCKLKVVGSIPTGGYGPIVQWLGRQTLNLKIRVRFSVGPPARIAQSVEQWSYMPLVVGSIPSVCTILAAHAGPTGSTCTS
jgi:hypothetical protein